MELGGRREGRTHAPAAFPGHVCSGAQRETPRAGAGGESSVECHRVHREQVFQLRGLSTRTWPWSLAMVLWGAVPNNPGTEKQDRCPQWPAGGSGAREVPGSRSWLHPGSPSSCCPVTVEGRWTSAGGSGLPEQPYLPVHLPDVLGCGRADGAASRQPWPTHSWVTLHSRTGAALSTGSCGSIIGGAPATPTEHRPHSQSSSPLAHFLLQNLQNTCYIFWTNSSWFF